MTGTVEEGAIEAAPIPDHVESPWRSATPAQRVVRKRLLLGVTALFIGIAAFFGFPTGREVITGWVLLFLFAACAGNLAVWARVVVRDWLPLLGVLFLYDFLRGSAEHVGAAFANLAPACRWVSTPPSRPRRTSASRSASTRRCSAGTSRRSGCSSTSTTLASCTGGTPSPYPSTSRTSSCPSAWPWRCGR